MSHTVVPRKLYCLVFAALLVLTAVTVAAALLDLGPFNLVVAMVIAGVKMMLVVVYFMHLRWSENLTRFAAVAGLLWLVIFMVLTISDFISRDWFLA